MVYAEFYPSSTVAEGSHAEKLVLDNIAEIARAETEQATKLETEVDNIEAWHKMDAFARKAVIDLYKQKAGVDLESESQQPLYFIPREKGGPLGFDKDTLAQTSPYSKTIIVGVGNDSWDYSILVAPIHERFHATGAVKITAISELDEGFFPFKRPKREIIPRVAEGGFRTKGSEGRGAGLEEAVTHYYSEKLLETTTEKEIVDIKKSLLEDLLLGEDDSPETSETVALIETMSDETFNKYEKETRTNIPDLYAETQIEAFNLFDTLVKRADALGIKEEFEKQTLLTRIHPENTRHYFELLSQVVGSAEMARRLYKLEAYDPEEEAKIIETLTTN